MCNIEFGEKVTAATTILTCTKGGGRRCRRGEGAFLDERTGFDPIIFIIPSGQFHQFHCLWHFIAIRTEIHEALRANNHFDGGGRLLLRLCCYQRNEDDFFLSPTSVSFHSHFHSRLEGCFHTHTLRLARRMNIISGRFIRQPLVGGPLCCGRRLSSRFNLYT